MCLLPYKKRLDIFADVNERMLDLIPEWFSSFITMGKWDEISVWVWDVLFVMEYGLVTFFFFFFFFLYEYIYFILMIGFFFFF
jgi:hypothetical protein